MFFYKLFNNHYWILVILLVFIGTLPVTSMGLTLIKSSNKKGYIFICISLVFILLSSLNIVREKYLSILVVFLVIVSMTANIMFKRINAKSKKE